METDHAVRDAVKALESAKAKIIVAGLMLANGGLKDHKAVVRLRGVVSEIGGALNDLRGDSQKRIA